MRYPVIIEKDGKGYLARIPDIPEARAVGDTREEVLAKAAGALVTALELYFEDSRQVPMPSDLKEGQESIALPSALIDKFFLFSKEQFSTPIYLSKADQECIARDLISPPEPTPALKRAFLRYQKFLRGD